MSHLIFKQGKKMKLTKLSLVAALAVSSAFAGGDIAPVEPVVEAPVVEAAACNSNTTISGKAQAYYYTNSSIDLFDQDSSQLGTAVTLDVKHNFTENIAANFSAVGFANTMSASNVFGNGYFENEDVGAFFNVANITASFGGTTLILGRQLIDSPMFGGFDWLLAPGAFEAYTVANNSIDNLTLVGTYVAKWRANNTGTEFADLAGDNYALGAVYANTDIVNASLWYYNIDAYGAAKYTQFYVDASKTFGSFDIAAQYVATDYDLGKDSDAYGIKAAAALGSFGLYAAYNDVSDRAAGEVGRTGLYTASWNNSALDSEIGSSWKVGATTELAGLTAELSYADYDTAGEEIDLILGYGITNCISVDAIYTSTAYDEIMSNEDALELVATYKF